MAKTLQVRGGNSSSTEGIHITRIHIEKKNFHQSGCENMWLQVGKNW